MGIFRNKKKEKSDGTKLQMITSYKETFYSWDGKLYKSDILRSCIRPKVQAIGKLKPKHIRKNKNGKIEIDPNINMHFLLNEPNPLMTSQQFQEKVANQYYFNNNAFILKVRNEDGIVIQLYPIPCVMVESQVKDDILYYIFTLRKGKRMVVPKENIIHLKRDYDEDDIFGTSPAPALTELMDMVGTIDQGIVKAIKNSAAIRWLLKFTNSMRPEDVKKNVENFVKNYLQYDTETFGAAGVDSKSDAIRIEPKDYVPNALIQERIHKRLLQFCNTNEKIVMSNWTEDEWNAFYESEIEPFAIQLGQVYTIELFKRSDRLNNYIVFEASNLMCASMSTKLNFVSLVDRGALLPDEWREMFNLPPVPGGDKPIRRLDTQVVDLIEKMLDKMDDKNYAYVTECIKDLIKTTERREEVIEAQN